MDRVDQPLIPHKLSKPEFFEKSGGFCVRIWTDNLQEEPRLAYSQLSPVQQEILSVLKAHRILAFKEINQTLSETLPRRTLQNELVKLKKRGLIEVQGKGSAARWFIK